MATQGTQNEEKQNKNTTQHALDSPMHKQTQMKHALDSPMHKQTQMT